MKLNSTRKKVVLGVILVSAIAVAGLQNVSAGPRGGGPNKWGGPQCGECGGYGYQGQQQLDEKSVEAQKTFLSETVELRKEFTQKKAEKRALMLNDNPNPKRVSELTGEIFDLREKLQSIAQEKGLRDVGFGRGQSQGCGGPGPNRF